MMIRNASLLFDIDDNLLCPETTRYLTPYAIDEQCIRNESSYKIRLQKSGTFLEGFSPTVKMKNVRYQETGPTMIVVDSFSAFRIDVDNRCMDICPCTGRYLQGLDFITDFKLLLSIAVLDKGGILLHSSAVCRDGAALVFTGRSGSGKTTIAQLLSPSWDVINDEFNVLIPENDRISIYSTPFGTVKSVPKETPSVRCIFTIKKSVSNRIEELPGSSVMMTLLKNICTFPSNDYYGNKLLENVHLLKNTLPVKRLLFLKNGTLNDFLETIALG